MSVEVTPAPAEEILHAFRDVPRTGVIFVSSEAARRGFRSDDPAWCNLGQGQPETGPLPGAPPRVSEVVIAPEDQEYAPIAGLPELREAVAELYNHLYRRGMGSRYTAENVAISAGGRSALTRAVAALGPVNLGHFLPDYTAYEELLDVFRTMTSIPILLSREAGYHFSPRDLRREVIGRGLSALLLSNPCNPMGRLISGDQLAEWVQVARQADCALLLDEFYSQYIWNRGAGEPGPGVSAARYVEDVDRDPVLLFDGLTKNFRYPGWRVCWTLGPRPVIEKLSSAGSFLDGGAARPMQRAAIQLLEPARVAAEGEAIRRAFGAKRDLLLRRLAEIGLGVDREPDGTFYVFAHLRDLPPSIADGMAFFRAALEHSIVTVPGVFFDVNPGGRRSSWLCRFHQYVRLSFGPSIDNLRCGLDRLEEMVREARARG
ncbi:MAG TPA: pyridoxal phosphate-dependent aminotransferase [Thermoanaerobaculia bacterium]|nr:pyridoxal phosphate-dependent aminotransferase [Thermoanaerobaculia bacterium]